MKWLRSKEAIEYARIGERTLRQWKKRGLRYAKIDGVDLFKVDWIDDFIEQFEVGENQVNEVVDDVLNGFI